MRCNWAGQLRTRGAPENTKHKTSNLGGEFWGFGRLYQNLIPAFSGHLNVLSLSPKIPTLYKGTKKYFPFLRTDIWTDIQSSRLTAIYLHAREREINTLWDVDMFGCSISWFDSNERGSGRSAVASRRVVIITD